MTNGKFEKVFLLLSDSLQFPNKVATNTLTGKLLHVSYEKILWIVSMKILGILTLNEALFEQIHAPLPPLKWRFDYFVHFGVLLLCGSMQIYLILI